VVTTHQEIAYPILDISADQVIGDEQLGTKPKFWFDHDGSRWLFKEAREIEAPTGNEHAGEDWAEKVAAEIAGVLSIPAAEVELATFQGRRGCASKRFTTASKQLMHGNEILAGYIENYDPGYDRTKWYRQSDHTLENIILAIRGMFKKKPENRVVLTQLASYLVLDALIGNVDRHHENWGLLWQVIVDHDDFLETSRVTKEYTVAPSYDHASSLGRELLDQKRIEKMRNKTVEVYVRKGHGGIYKAGGKRGENPLGLVESASAEYADYFMPTLDRLRGMPLERLTATVDLVPDARISIPARNFAKAMLGVAYQSLTRIGT
jgi:hypothetical protein